MNRLFAIPYLSNILLISLSVLFSVLIVLAICESVFYLDKNSMFYKISIHFQINEFRKQLSDEDHKQRLPNEVIDEEKYYQNKTLTEEIIVIETNSNI